MIQLFSHLLHDGFVDNFDSIQDKLINFCYKEKEKFTTGYGDSKGLQISNGENSWHSEKEYYKNNILSETVQLFLNNYFDKNNIFKDGTGFCMNSLWFMINSKGGYNKRHRHFHKTDCALSGVFWIKVPKDSGDIIFHNPDEYYNYQLNESYSNIVKNIFNQKNSYSISPKEGKVILFPSHLDHSVNKNFSNQDRISISFNINIQPPRLT
tara:strand:+ start:44 stop:673 length:630 start_codon:yes stop_codon:yes gene_type:complete